MQKMRFYVKKNCHKNDILSDIFHFTTLLVIIDYLNIIIIKISCDLTHR